MYCKKCGSRLPENAKFCPECGAEVGEHVIIEDRFRPKKATFKEGIMALFNKIFVFEGRSTRSEFNYGFLFLLIVSTIVSSFTVSQEMMNVMMNAGTNPEMMDILLEQYFSSKDIFNSFNLYNIAVSLVMAIFLSAPVFRRLTDAGFNKKLTIVLTVVFVVSQIACSTLLYCLLPADVYKVVEMFIDILSYANTIILFICMLKRSK